MIEVLNWMLEHWLFIFFFGLCLFAGVESLIKVWRGN